jgi:hypothetical protein
MKTTSILTSAVFAAVLTAGLQAYAVTTIWYDGSQSSMITGHSVGLPQEIAGSPYTGSITWSSLLTGPGGNPYNGQGLSGGTLAVDITGDLGVTIQAWIGTIPLVSVIGDGGWSDFSLTSAAETYIENSPTHTISFTVEADCDLQGYYMSLTSTNSSSTVPDGGSTVALLGGVLTTLGLIKRKMA